ncbi:hypothetical protein B0H11DRAFT_2256131 [Mycena galericulata]|nr:hypothetical protein B0H11DRAFT_2256131 [Mycena galericulata]
MALVPPSTRLLDTLYRGTIPLLSTPSSIISGPYMDFLIDWAHSQNLKKKAASYGPLSSMFFLTRRPVFSSNVAPLDEGRPSEFESAVDIGSVLIENNMQYNRVPQVLIYDYKKKSYRPMSFHRLHQLGPSIVMNLTVSPLSFALVNITVVAKREEDLLASPNKMVLNRKVVAFDFDSDEDRRAAKKDGAGGGSGSGSRTAGPDQASSSR